jgi:preprotein translocase subunit SecG
LETALFLALIIISFVLIALVILQGRTAGLQSRDTSSIYRTKRGLEKTMHQTTIVLAVVFLLLALITSLPFSIFTSTAPTGLIGLLGLF